ncbi:MAG: AMP-binding protein [Chloroflexota bacterium]
MTGPIFGTDTGAAAWRPSPAYLERSQLARFLRAHRLDDLEALQARAVADPAWFWGAAVRDIGVSFDPEPGTILDTTRGIEWARWFGGAGFNYVRMAVDEPAAARPDELALVWEGEDREVRQFTRAQLRWAVDRAARAIAAQGVSRGERIGIFLPMIPEAVIAVLAVGKLGAIYTPIFSGYGADAVASRLADCDASLLITADGFARRGKPVAMKATADEALAHAPSVRRCLVVRHTGADVAWNEERDVWWDAAVASASAEPLETAATDANDPFMIIYTSGTTGRPKGALHVHGGFPIKAAVDLAHGFDLQAGDTLFWFTDMGWMMGPWAVAGAPMLGATLFIYEGTPDYPGPDRLWGLVERHRITHLGISPTLVRALMTHGSEPPRSHDLSSLVVLGSTGEPWNLDPWWWLFREVGGERLPIINYSGGTEISGGILGCTTLSPIDPCSFSGPSPGMAADVVDAAGQPLRGEVGELVIRQPWPGMTQGFWHDRERYLEAYWSRLPGVWVHGDWARIDEAGYWYISGRSDDTIKVAGKRIGPAEVESAAVAHPSVVEALAIGVPDEIKGETIVLFGVVSDSAKHSQELAASISRTVVEHLGKSFKPGLVHLVPSLPKTRNGKILRRLARSAYLGLDPGDTSSLEDSTTLEPIRVLRAP